MIYLNYLLILILIYHLNEKINVLNQDCQTLLHNERVLLERYGNLEKHLSEIKEENQFLE